MLPEAASAAAWLHYMLEAERMTRGLPRAVVHYADLLQDWPGCMTRAGRTANVAWPNPIGPFRHETGGVVLRSLRHHIAAAGSVTVGPPPLRGVINEAWTAFLQLGDNPALPSAKEKLDDVRRRFAVHRYASRRQVTPNNNCSGTASGSPHHGSVCPIPTGRKNDVPPLKRHGPARPGHRSLPRVDADGPVEPGHDGLAAGESNFRPIGISY
jgi:hypothetical protein